MLSLDRPFTYLLPTGSDGDPGVGSLVKVPFHGRAVRGWVLGPTDDVPVRTLAVQTVVSPVRFFDEELLALAQWVSRRYVAPLSAVLGRLTPPRVASEETQGPAVTRPGIGERGAPVPVATRVLPSYRGGPELMDALHDRRAPGRGWILRPAPDHEVAAAVELVGACLAEGRRVLVIVPEATPVPATARAISEAFAERTAVFLGGSKRARYRMWLAMQEGDYDVVVGTRPAVFAPIADLGLILVSRESHPAHREDRAPYYHVRDVALARAGRSGAVCVLSALCPSSEAAASGLKDVVPAQRRWPPVEIVRPGVEGRAPRLIRALKESRRAFLFSPLPGYGIAAFCLACGEPATCRACSGALRSEEGSIVCVVCGAPGRCAKCGASAFGLRRGGAERVEEWAARVTEAQVRRLREDDTPRLPEDGEVLVGGPDDVRDLGPAGLDLVAILDADLAERRPGLSARERAVTTWMEAIAWAYPHGRAIVQSSHAGDPAVQALVKGKPDRFHADEAARRAAAGFPVGSAVFRIGGNRDLEQALRMFEPITLLITGTGDQTICLLALDPEKVPAFGLAIRELAARDVVSRVEAEPHL